MIIPSVLDATSEQFSAKLRGILDSLAGWSVCTHPVTWGVLGCKACKLGQSDKICFNKDIVEGPVRRRIGCIPRTQSLLHLRKAGWFGPDYKGRNYIVAQANACSS